MFYNERIIVLYHIINLLFLNIFYFFLRQTSPISRQIKISKLLFIFRHLGFVFCSFLLYYLAPFGRFGTSLTDRLQRLCKHIIVQLRASLKLLLIASIICVFVLPLLISSILSIPNSLKAIS